MTLDFYRTLSTYTLLAALLVPSGLVGSAFAQTKPAVTRTQVEGTLNLNTADEAQLTRLPGIGPAKAKAIIELRGRMKRFKRIEDLMRVRGIGRKTFRDMRPMLTLEGETTLSAKKK